MLYNIEEKVGSRLNLVRELLLLTVEEVFVISKIPPTTLRRIEKGIFPSNPEYTNKLSNLYQISKEDLYNLSKQLPDWKKLRKSVLSVHRDDEFIISALNKQPAQKKAVQFRVLKSNFLNDFKTVNETVIHLKQTYNWTYGDSDITNVFEALLNEQLLELRGKNIRPQQYRKFRGEAKLEEQVVDQIAVRLEEITPAAITNLLTPVFEKMAGMMMFISKESKAKREIFQSVNYGNLEKNHQKSLKVLHKLDLVEMTEVKPSSSLQKYVLTRKGKELLKQFGVDVY